MLIGQLAFNMSFCHFLSCTNVFLGKQQGERVSFACSVNFSSKLLTGNCNKKKIVYKNYGKI